MRFVGGVVLTFGSRPLVDVSLTRVTVKASYFPTGEEITMRAYRLHVHLLKASLLLHF